MGSSQTLKQKFIDLLFEDEYDISNNEKKNKKNEKRMKASDLLYKKNEVKDEDLVDKKVEKEPRVNNAFIDYEQKEIKRPIKETSDSLVKEQVEETYVAQPFLSPIFGNLDKDKKKQEKPVSHTKYVSLKKPNSSYLGTVLSPIYGYETTNDIKDNKETVLENKNNKADFTSDLTDIFSTVELSKKDISSVNDLDKTSEIDLFDDYYKAKD